MGLTREERKLLHHKAKQPTFGDGEPKQTQGYDGDITFRNVEGSGTVEYVKERGNWKAVASSGEMPTVKIYGGGGGSSSGSGGGVTNHYDLSGLSGDHHTHYILVDGTRAFTGNQSFGGFNVTNVGDLDVDGHATLDQVTIDTSDGAFSVDGTNGTTINSTAGSLSIGNDADDFQIYIGTGGERLIQIGNSSAQTTSQIDVYAAQGGINFDTVAHATSNTGDITFETGDATATNSGSIIFHPGQAPLGTPGNIAFDAEGGQIQIGKNTAAGDIYIGTNATARTIYVGDATTTEFDLNTVLVDINAGTGGTKIESDGVVEIDSKDSTRLKMQANVTGNRTLKIEAANSHLTGFGKVDIDADGDIDITAGGGLDIGAVGTTLDTVTLSIDSTDTTNLSMNANDGGDKTLTIDAENAGVGLGKFELNADIITFNTPYVATSDENQTNAIGSWNFTTNDDLSFYSNGTDTWINASDNYLKLYSAFDMYLIVDGEQLYIQDTSTNTVYTFDVGATPALTVLASDANGAPFLIENQGTDGDIKLRPMGGDLYIQSSGSNNTFRFNATTSQFLINNVFDNTLDPQITFTDDDSGDIWSIGADVDDTNSDPKFKIHSTASLAADSDFELDTSGNGAFRGDLEVSGKNITMGTFAQELDANLEGRLEIENTRFGVHINEPYTYSDSPGTLLEYWDSWNVRTQLGDFDGDPLSQHLAGGYADFYNNYFFAGCFVESHGTDCGINVAKSFYPEA